MAIQISGTTVIDNSRNIVNANAIVATSYFNVPSGNTAARPSVSGIGHLRFNTDYNILEFYDGSNWREVFFR